MRRYTLGILCLLYTTLPCARSSLRTSTPSTPGTRTRRSRCWRAGDLSSRVRPIARQERRFAEPRDDLTTFGVTFGEQLVGYVELALIDLVAKRAACGIVLGDPVVWERGVGSRAICLLLNYAFTAKGLERV